MKEKWKHHQIIKLTNGLFGNHTETCRAINQNADVLQECCQRIRELEKQIEELKKQIK